MVGVQNTLFALLLTFILSTFPAPSHQDHSGAGSYGGTSPIPDLINSGAFGINVPVGTSGGTVTIWGDNFGTVGESTPLAIHINGHECHNPTVIASTVSGASQGLVCITAPPGSGADNYISITWKNDSPWGTLGGVYSHAFSYVGPTLLTQASFPYTTPGQWVTITGKDFGPVGTTVIAEITSETTGNHVQNTTGYVITQHTALVITSVRGIGTANTLKVWCDGLESQNTINFGYSKPIVVSADAAPTIGGTITIRGNSFGAPATSDGAFTPSGSQKRSFTFHVNNGLDIAADYECSGLYLLPNDDYTTLDQAVCSAPQGTGDLNTITAKVGFNTDILTSDPLTYTYDKPLPTQGGTGVRVEGTPGGSYDVRVSDESILHIEGTNFGTAESLVEVFLGPYQCTGVNITTVNDITKILRCLVPDGAGQKLPVIILVGDMTGIGGVSKRIGTVAQYDSGYTVSYPPPLVYQILPPMPWNTNNMFVSVIGANFGPTVLQSYSNGTTPERHITIGGLECTSPTYSKTSDGYSIATCYVDNTLLGDHQRMLGVLIDNQFFNHTFRLVRKTPFITSTSPSHAFPTSAQNNNHNYTIFLHGEFFGPQGISGVFVEVGFQSGYFAEVYVYNDTNAHFRLPEGTGANRKVQITVDNIASGFGNYEISYQAPHMESITFDGAPHLPTLGMEITILGNNFGPASFPAGYEEEHSRVFYVQGAKCHDPVVEGHTKIRCYLEGTGRYNRTFVFNVDGLEDDFNTEINFSHPHISSLVDSGAHPTRGGVTFTISGSNFGPAGTVASVTVGQWGPVNATVIGDNHDTAVLNSPEGSGANNNVLITVDGTQSNPSHQNDYTYDTPSITSIVAIDVPTLGGLITVLGDNFGANNNPNVRDIMLAATPCTSPVFFNHDTIACKIPAGTGNHTVSVSVSIDGQSTSADGVIGYHVPVIGTINPQAIDTDGRELITITGSNFGRGNVTVTVGGVSVTGTVQNSTTEDVVVFTAPAGEGAHNLVVVIVDGLSSINVAYLSYAVPAISSLSLSSTNSTRGGETLTITGDNFGPLNSTVAVYIAQYDCLNAFVSVASTEIQCIVPPMTGKNMVVSVVIGDQTAFSATNVSVPAPEIHLVYPTTGIPTAGGWITINGSNFGPAISPIAVSRTVTINGRLCTDPGFDHDTLTCFFPHGTGSHLFHIGVTIDTQPDTSNFESQISYGIPVVDLVVPDTFVPAHSMITIYGTNFGGSDIQAKRSVRVGARDCVGVRLVSDSELLCMVTGSGASQAVTVTVDGLTSEASFTIDYLDVTSPGLQCVPPSGSQDRFQQAMCNCWSGYAPSDDFQTDCSRKAICPGYAADLNSLTSGGQPSRPETQFDEDRLYIKQTMPISERRRSTNIRFVTPKASSLAPSTPAAATPGKEGSHTCFYPGPTWNKTVDSRDCMDVYQASVPWTMHELCGFVLDDFEDTKIVDNSIAQMIYYKSELVTTYTEVQYVESRRVQRTMSTSYLITVSFAKALDKLFDEIFSVVIDDPTVADFVTVSVLGDSLYDPATGKVYVSFQTSVGWPYKLDPHGIATGQFVAAHNNDDDTSSLSYAINVASGRHLSCTHTPDSICLQQWIAMISVGSGSDCVGNIAGTFPITDALLCRDVLGSADGPCSSPLTAPFSLISGHTDLCNTEAVDASAGHDIELLAYGDSSFNGDSVQQAFKTGDTIYFGVSIVNPLATIDSVAFENIFIAHGDDFQDIYDTTNLVDGGPIQNQNINFRFSELTSQLAPGNTGLLTFSFNLFRDQITPLANIGTDSDSLAYEIEVVVVLDIYYHGNSKRSLAVRAALPSKQSSGEANIKISVLPSEKDIVAARERQEAEDLFAPSSASPLYSLSQLTVLLLAAVFAVTCLV
eukprot:TRINITY_DN2640_c0_g2_i1.p1 TRINITY_DN2640_c0_g2~~TRINITY_DN2640_c0_g2_i1.p1  ORF type:complete len:1878 (-),score=367.54 TRINITY_DN2640_c0_g2_i1:103-5736(-)